MNKKGFILVFLLLLAAGAGYAQRRPVYEPKYRLEKGFLIHFPSPLTWLAKFGLAVEYKVGVQRSIMFGYYTYYGYFPGYQGSATFRQYVETRGKHENFFYVKGGVGHADYSPPSSWSHENQVFVAPGDYFFAGGGVGYHRNFGHFFFEVVTGLKYSFVANPIADYNEKIFYVTGPGSFLDGGINFGVQF